MSFGILSGTTSNALGCCAPTANARPANMPPAAIRMCALMVYSPVGCTTESAENLVSCGADLLFFMRLLPRDANTSDADSFHDDGQPALHRRDAGHAEHRVAPCLDAFLPH